MMNYVMELIVILVAIAAVAFGVKYVLQFVFSEKRKAAEEKRKATEKYDDALGAMITAITGGFGKLFTIMEAELSQDLKKTEIKYEPDYDDYNLEKE